MNQIQLDIKAKRCIFCAAYRVEVKRRKPEHLNAELIEQIKFEYDDDKVISPKIRRKPEHLTAEQIEQIKFEIEEDKINSPDISLKICHKHTNMSSVKVAVRVRPLNKRENNVGSKCIVEMEGKRTSIINLKMSNNYGSESDDQLGRERVKDFFFDYSYWSCDESSPNFSSQSVVFKDLGTGVVQAADEGYNACIFAYGQTGSGKTHTMMGQPGNEGLIPRICEALFQQIRAKEGEGVSFRSEVSYLEIYNERVRDLLRPVPKNEKDAHTLKVREHPKDGPCVQGLTKHLVSDYAAIEQLMIQGNELRTTASTNMNDTSSRSHAIFTVNYTQAKFLHDLPSETTSKINLVDLAGSERADSTGATGIRLKEGANINKSLVTLGSVISSLADLSMNTKKKKTTFIPYRDSVLTWLLKDSLGGNSKTIMIATLSPADCNYAETLSTLRYANRAKNIVNKPTVNEDDNVKLIRELREEIDKLKGIIGKEVVMSDGEKATAQKLFENEERLGALTDKWKDRWKEMQNIMQERELAFQHRVDAGIRMESELPHLVALEDDLLSTGVLLYHLKDGKTFVGTEKSKTKPDIVISAPSILDEHCIIENNDGFVLLEPFPDATCCVNGTAVRKRQRLQQGDVVTLGKTAIFRFNHPKEAEELREKRKSIGPPVVTNVNKFRETDLLPKMRNPERDKREEDLAKQLEEARLLLEKQKQEEERRMEETRNEFARQIREESRRLQETRGELESQRKGRINEPQNIDQIRAHIDSLQQHHKEAEEKRLQREKELAVNIEQKEQLIETQRNTLTEFEKKCAEVKSENDRNINTEVEQFMIRRGEETTKLNEEIRKVVDATRDENDKELLDEIRALWETETNRVAVQENICAEITNDFNASLSLSILEPSKRNGDIAEENETEAVCLQKEDISKKLSYAHTTLEEMQHNKAKVLKKYEQDYKHRFEFICWEKERALKKVKEKIELCDNEKRSYQESLIDSQSVLDEVKARYFNTVSQENEMLSAERSKFDLRKKELMKKSIEEQQCFNDKVQQYRLLLKKGQENINEKKSETEQLRQELTELMKIKGENVTTKINALRVELNDKIEDMHELEKNHNVVKKEEEKVIQNMLTELNMKKQQNDKDVEMSDKLLLELEQTSREKILMLQEEVDATEKTVLQYRSNIDRSDERLLEIDLSHESDTAKLDTELLYVAYMIEKKFHNDTEGHEYTTIQNSKTKLEDVYQVYKLNLENIQKETDNVWKPLVDNREQAQVVLEDLVRARGIAEVTLTELKEQFESEHKEEVEEIESWRERLADLEEEKNISSFCSENEISDNQMVTENLLLKEKQDIEDGMYEKIILMERTMQAEIDQLKIRETELLRCVEENKFKKENGLEVGCDVSVEDLTKLQQLLEEKERELNTTKERDNREIEELRAKLDNANKEIMILHEELDKYVSMTSLTIGTLSDEELSENEVRNLLMRVNESSGIDEEDEEIARLRISPPPTPINRYLQSVSIYKRNQIKVHIPRFILRGIGRDSYHVFEVKLNVGDEHWTVYRRYRRFRELHRQTLLDYPIVANLEFPSKRFFGNRAEKFVKIRRAQLETYLTAFFAIMSNVSNCLLYAVSENPLTKQDIGRFHPFFKQGVYEYTKNENDFINR